ncbi:MAG TPA: hypothetical protein VN416_08965 [Desulfomonilia bacterium]|jgi:hypothetical protein|nr:hypothetical protein [Desulfomonilia bacterium]
MQKVPIELVRPGMILARTINNDAGMALCGEGTELTDVIIERLKRMNVSHVTLRGHPVDLGQTKTKEQKIVELKARFIHVQGDPLMDMILAASESALIALEEERQAQEAEEGGLP